MINRLTNLKNVLDDVHYNYGKQQYDFFVAGTYEKDGEKKFTKWKKYGGAVMPIDFDGSCDDWETKRYFEQINQRQILPNELVLDVEEAEEIYLIVQKLKETKHINNFSIWKTGSRGYHIHIFSSKPIPTKVKLFITKSLGTDVQKASEKNLIALENMPHWKTGKLKINVTDEFL